MFSKHLIIVIHGDVSVTIYYNFYIIKNR